MADDIMAQIESIMDAEVDSVIEGRTSEESEKDSGSQKPDNYDYRLKAAQRQQQKAERIAAEKLSAIEQKLDLAMRKFSGEVDEEPSSDDIISDVQRLKAELAAMKAEKERETFRSRDRAFFSNHPDLDPMETSQELTSFLQGRTKLAEALVSGEIDLEDVYVQYSYRKGANQGKSDVQKSESVFGGKPEPVSRGRAPVKSKLDKAYEILDNKNSTNKREAVQILEEQLMAEIQSQLY